MQCIKNLLYIGTLSSLLLLSEIVAADYMIGQYYCYETPYHHCVYYARPASDATEVQHRWMPFYNPEPAYYPANPAYRQYLDPRGYEY